MISIVMPSLNQADYIRRAVDSVFDQDNVEVELIVSDGGSTDGTIEILKQCSAQYQNISWISEPDTGPAQAINKALGKTRGSIIGWINSDDIYEAGVFSHIANFFEMNPDMVMVYGQGMFVDTDDNDMGIYPTLSPEGGISEFENGCFISQPTVFFKKTVHKLVGPLNESFQASFDFDYWVRVFDRFEHRIGFMDRLIAKTRLHNQTITSQNRQTVALEGAKILSNHFGWAPIHWVATYFEEMFSTNDKTLGPKEIDILLYKFAKYFDPEDFNVFKNQVKS